MFGSIWLVLVRRGENILTDDDRDLHNFIQDEPFVQNNSAMLSGYSTFDEEFGKPVITIGSGRKNCEIFVNSCW